MRLIKFIFTITLFCGSGFQLFADEFEDLRQKQREEFERIQNRNKTEFSDHKEKIRKEYNEYRAKINAEYSEYLRDPWKKLNKVSPVRPPVDPEPTPFIIREEEDKIKPAPEPIEIDTVITPPTPTPQPEPVVPILPDPSPKPTIERDKTTYYGTTLEFTKLNLDGFRLKDTSEKQIASAWNKLCELDYDDFLTDCLDIRTQMQLPDWGYFKLLDKVLMNYYPKSSDEHTFTLAFFLVQSGYKIRLGYDMSNKLIMLFNAKGTIYDRSGFMIDGEKFYVYEPINGNSAYIAPVAFEAEKALSVGIRQSPKFKYLSGNKRQVNVKNHPELNLITTPNKNLIDFWNDYLDGSDTDSSFGRWIVQGNCPLSDNMRNDIYPNLKDYIKGYNQNDAANILLKVAQSFPYGYDSDEWGVDDRIFWVEETWHYPKSDCEDHAIHFSRLIRDLLGLNAVLIYYPGHLSCAIEITDGSAHGDYLIFEGKHYTVCDATCFYSQVGYTPPSYDNSKATLIPLQK